MSTADILYTGTGDTLSLLPDFYESSRQMRAICSAVDYAMTALWADLNRVLCARFLTFPQSEALDEVERRIGLDYTAGLDPKRLPLEDRAGLIRFFLYLRSPFTEKKLRQGLKWLTEDYSMVIDPRNTSLSLRLCVPSAAQYNRIWRILKHRLPANLTLHATGAYRTNDALTVRTHGQMYTDTHCLLRNLVGADE